MKILLDENIPIELKNNFENSAYEIFTVRDNGWEGKKNGELLKLMVENGFDVLVSIDKNIDKQQNITKYPLTLIILNALNNKIQTLSPFLPKIKELLNSELRKGIIKVEL